MAFVDLHIQESDNIDYNLSDRNFSNYTELWVRKSSRDIILKSVGLLPIQVLGIFGNVSILVVMLKIKGMRTSTNIFICNMALADLMTILFCSWTIIFVDGFQFFVLGPIYCRLYGFFHVTFLLCSVFSLSIISGDRLLGIVFPFSRRLTSGQSWVIVAITWIAAMACAAPTAIWRWLLSRQWNDLEEVWCNENVKILKYYWLTILILMVYIPLIIMAVAHTTIILQLDKYEHKLFLREHPLKMKYRKKVIKVLFMYVLTFIVFWGVFQVVVLYNYFKPLKEELAPWYRDTYFAAHVLTYAQSAINPVIYAACNESFRRAFRITCGCFFKSNKIRPMPNYVHSPPNHIQVLKQERQNCKDPGQSTEETEFKETPSEPNCRHSNKTRTITRTIVIPYNKNG